MGPSVCRHVLCNGRKFRDHGILWWKRPSKTTAALLPTVAKACVNMIKCDDHNTWSGDFHSIRMHSASENSCFQGRCSTTQDHAAIRQYLVFVDWTGQSALRLQFSIRSVGKQTDSGQLYCLHPGGEKVPRTRCGVTFQPSGKLAVRNVPGLGLQGGRN